jgi:serine/threonine protein kinase
MATNSKSARAPDGSMPHAQPPIRLSEGRIVNAAGGAPSKFRLVAELGRGGMGNVYLAVVSGPAGFNKLQVIKRLRPELAQDVESVTMFLDEARLAARLSHPNVVQTNEVGHEGAHYFIAMEYLEGQSLDQIVRRASSSPEGMPLAIHLRIICEALAGLHHAHELTDFDGSPLRLVHRDVTPQNIFVTYDGISKLLDFGIAKAATSAHETRAGTFKGKCAYMPPEQIVGDAIDRRADLFSVGAVLWQAATGQRLWKGEPDMKIFHRVVNGDIPSPRSVNPRVPEQLEKICMRALASRREERFSNALEMQAAIEGFLDESGLKPTARDVARFVSELFTSERAAMRTAVDAQLRELSKSSEPLMPLPIPVLIQTAEEPSGSGHRARSDGSSHSSLQAGVIVGSASDVAHSAAHAPRGRGVLLGLLFALGLGVVAARQLRPSISAPIAASAPQSATLAPAASTPSSSTVADTRAPASPETVLVLVHLAASPASARIFVDDAPLATNPIDNKFVRDGAAHLIRAEAPGFRAKTQLVPFNGERISVTIKLEPEPPPRRGAPSRASSPASRPFPDPPARPTTQAPPIDTADPYLQ